VPADARFVSFVAARYPALFGLSGVALAIAVMAASPLLTRAWDWPAAVTAGAILAGLIGVLVPISRYYARQFGRVQAGEAEKRPWYIATVIFLIERAFRRLVRDGYGSGLLAVSFAILLLGYAWRDRFFRKQSFILPATLAYIGIDRLTASFDVDPWVWGQRAVVLLASAFLVTSLCDHFLIVAALSPERRRLAMSSAAMPRSGGRVPAVACDPIAATMLTALGACAAADVRFLANIAGVRPADAVGWLTNLAAAGLVWIEHQDRADGNFTIRLSTPGHDTARALWDAGRFAPQTGW
jgi:hypothetical protein